MTAPRVLVASNALSAAIGDVGPDVEFVALDPGDEPRSEHRRATWIVLGGELMHLVPRLGEFPELEVVQTLNAGVEWLLPHVPPGLTVCNASGPHDIPVAEWVVGVVLALYRQFPTYFAAQQRGEWDTTGNALTTPPDEIPGDDLEGKRVTIVGYGSIGRAVAERLGPFGARVRGIARHPGDGVAGPGELGELLPSTDVLVLLCPLTDETRGLIDAGVLATLPDGAVVVNAARGPVVDQDALERELRTGRLRAALDVTDPEPLPSDHSLWSAPNVIITPHSAGSTRHWLRRAYAFVGDQIRRATAGEPLQNVRTDY